MNFALVLITSIAFAEDTSSTTNPISTDRPSIGTSASVLSKNSIQLESGFQRKFYSLGALEEMMICEDQPCASMNDEIFQAMGRIGMGWKLELRPYYNISLLDMSSSSGGMEVKANLFSSDASPHTLGILLSTDLSAHVLQFMWDIGGESWSGWLNGGVYSLFIEDIENTFYPIGTIGVGKSFVKNHNIYMEYAVQGDKNNLWSTGYYKSFGNYQIDCFAITDISLSPKTWHAGIGFSWKIK